MIYNTFSEKETAYLGSKYAEYLKPRIGDGLTVCLNGEMGSGKTAFVKGMMETFHYNEEVTSPTFALCHKYEGDTTVFHIDLYRLESFEDFFSMGLFDIEEKGSLILIEWAEKANDYIENCITVNFKYGEKENSRIIDIPDFDYMD